MTENRPKVAGLHRASLRVGDCGLCGQTSDLTKTHLPPQCAFNTKKVERRYQINRGNYLEDGRPSAGGVWFRGLCRHCNELQGLYDGAYGELARKLKSCWVKDWSRQLPLRRPVPQFFTLKPGAVVRSVLIGMFGLNPNLRYRLPDIAGKLLDKEVFELPAGQELRLALFRGSIARVSGAIGGFDSLVPGSVKMGVMSDAQVYFPPLAWEFADKESRDKRAPSFSSILDAYGWADVSEWTTIDAREHKEMHRYFRDLPAVAHPRDMPSSSEGWIELVSDKLSEMIVGDVTKQ